MKKNQVHRSLDLQSAMVGLRLYGDAFKTSAGEKCCRRTLEDGYCREMLGRSVAVKCFKEVSYKSVVGSCWREVLQWSIGEKCCGELL